MSRKIDLFPHTPWVNCSWPGGYRFAIIKTLNTMQCLCKSVIVWSGRLQHPVLLGRGQWKGKGRGLEALSAGECRGLQDWRNGGLQTGCWEDLEAVLLEHWVSGLEELRD